MIEIARLRILKGMKNMKYELMKFDKKQIKNIHENFKVEVCKNENSKTEKTFIEEECEKNIRYQKLLKLKAELDSGKLQEKDIPDEYIEDLKKLYEDKIRELSRKIEK